MLLKISVYGDSQDLRQSPIFEDLTFYRKKPLVKTEINNKQYYIISDHGNYMKKIKQGKRKESDHMGIFQVGWPRNSSLGRCHLSRKQNKKR